MGETDETGKLTKAYGFNPIAMQQGLWSTNPIWQANVNNGGLTENGTSYHYLHTDHLGTPQLATTKEGQTSWKAQSEAFGAAGVQQNQSSIQMNLRFPGQYFDQETGSHYNFFRDYRSSTGRYIESDPIKIMAGANFYAYVSASPLRYSDALGLRRLPGYSDLTEIDYELLSYFKYGKGGFKDLSRHCAKYNAQLAIGARMDELEYEIDQVTSSYAGTLAPGQVVSEFIRKQNTNTLMGMAWSFGVGAFHIQTADCKIVGIDCECAESDCKFKVTYIDEFKDIVDLCRDYEACWLSEKVDGALRTTPFWFGLSCDAGSYGVKKCR